MEGDQASPGTSLGGQKVRSLGIRLTKENEQSLLEVVHSRKVRAASKAPNPGPRLGQSTSPGSSLRSTANDQAILAIQLEENRVSGHAWTLTWCPGLYTLAYGTVMTCPYRNVRGSEIPLALFKVETVVLYSLAI